MEKTILKDIERNSNIELLRIFCAMAVILLHINITSIPLATGLNKVLIYLFEALSICAVDMFILISGYFLCQTEKRNYKKIVEIIAEVICIKVVIYLFTILAGNKELVISDFIASFVPNNYFVIFYSVLYFVSVYYNKCLSNLDNKSFKSLVILLFVFFSIEPTFVDFFNDILNKNITGLSTITRNGSMYGYNFINFSLLYILGAYIKRINKKINISYKNIICFIFIMVLLIFVWSYYGYEKFKPVNTALSYCNPLIIFNTVAIFLLFKKITIKNSVINKLAKSCFTCYLLHGCFLIYLPYNYIVNQNPLFMLFIIALSLLAIYLICYIAHLIWCFVFSLVFSKWQQNNK